MNEKTGEIMATIIVLIVLILAWLGIWAGSSYFEARAYNRITGKNVSTFDAMFVKLRVQEGAK